MKRFEGKIALITGAAQGIGLATVKRLLAEGAKVVGADIKPDVVPILAAIGARGIVADVSVQESVQRLFDAATADEGYIDVLVNNAGITSAADFLDYALPEFERVIRINMVSAFMLSQLVARHLVARRAKGAIVNVSSINGQVALPHQTAYVTSKGALNQLTKVMAISLAAHGIRVNAVAPGTIVTDMSRARLITNEENRLRMLARTPLGRPGEVDEVASVVAFLASDDASYVTGDIVNIDGGRLALNGVVDSPAA
jgi:NAD(P)-dependent dehydrogenase (short-subunit alcohol dehydrogenase family)